MRTLDQPATRTALEDYGLAHPSGRGFSFRDPERAISYDWHDHPYHQLIYAVAGTIQIETDGARHLLPTGRAAWIPAGQRHRTLVHDVDTASLYFAPDAVADDGGRVRILVASPVMREMILHALRWPQDVAERDPVARSFFETLALMCGEWLESELPLSLPGARHPGIVRAMDLAVVDPAGIDLPAALAAAAMSERSFRRAFSRETGMGWQAWVAQLRILRAMGMLADGGRVTDVAAEVGYASLSAFAKAFAQLAGEGPADYRSRVRGRTGGDRG
ncbi:AraC family transcriptional regulator [Rhizorhabdus histidinilytica]|uniref:AraC family transcriptional regulator n=1 Tax=Rhizorhabdus histidinilytica TaxID=439228 RepID=UPI00321FA9ED